MENWYKDSFSQDYVQIYQHRDLAEAESTIDSLLRFIELPSNPLCLDLCCGFGRHLDYLNRRGLRTVGIDLSPFLLSNARQLRHGEGRLIQGDMRAIPLRSAFDFVFSFFSSFGYFADDEENLAVLREINRVLKPGGGILLDYLNPQFIRRNLQAEDFEEFNGYTLRQKRWIDDSLNMVEKDLTISDSAGERTYRERVKLYDLNQFEQFFREVGFRLCRVSGNTEGAPLTDDSTRLILIGEKIENTSP